MDFSVKMETRQKLIEELLKQVLGTAEVPRLMELWTVHRLFLYGRPVHPASGARLGAKPDEVEEKKKKKKRRRGG